MLGMMPLQNKVIVIGVDGGTLNLIENWVKKGKLPTFSRIMNGGVYGNLRSTIPWYSAPAWVSIVTGCQPGKHGIYDFFRTDSFSKKIVSSRLRKVPAVWNLLSENDKTSIVVNVPGTYPPEKINGVMITGLLTPSPDSMYTYPPSIKKELIPGKLGRYELEQVAVDDIPKGLTARYAPERLAEQVNAITTSHATVTMNLMERYKWDFTMVVFRGTDDVQHLLWNRMDLVLSCYQKADEYIGEMIDRYPDATFIIVSDHGFGKPKKYFYVNNALYNAGYLKTKSNPTRNMQTLTAAFFEKSSRILFHILPIQRIVRSSIGRKLILSSGGTSGIDFDSSKAFYHSVCSRGIRIIRKDKYGRGLVDEDNYEKVREELIEFLKNIRDPDTDEKIVEKVYKWEEIYGEDAVNDPLDIIFDLKEEYGAQELLQPPQGLRSMLRSTSKLEILSPPGFYDWLGDHRRNGILFMYGNNIERGKRIDASVLDITPTVLALLGVPIPTYIDGSIISNAFIEKIEVKRIDYKEKKLTEAELKRIRKLRLKL